jgi:hypothetical protein
MLPRRRISGAHPQPSASGPRSMSVRFTAHEDQIASP